jgi:hypothetical protein
MNNFFVDFNFEGHKQRAKVDVIDRPGHSQFTVWPLDEHLQKSHGAQVFHQLRAGKLETAFPIADKGRVYTDAIRRAILEYLSNEG